MKLYFSELLLVNVGETATHAKSIQGIHGNPKYLSDATTLSRNSCAFGALEYLGGWLLSRFNVQGKYFM